MLLLGRSGNTHTHQNNMMQHNKEVTPQHTKTNTTPTGNTAAVPSGHSHCGRPAPNQSIKSPDQNQPELLRGTPPDRCNFPTSFRSAHNQHTVGIPQVKHALSARSPPAHICDTASAAASRPAKVKHGPPQQQQPPRGDCPLPRSAFPQRPRSCCDWSIPSLFNSALLGVIRLHPHSTSPPLSHFISHYMTNLIWSYTHAPASEWLVAPPHHPPRGG